MMLIASLQNHCIDAIIRYLHDYLDCYQSTLINQLVSDEFNERFAHLILNKIVTNYPSMVTDKLLQTLCHGKIKNIFIKNCTEITINGLSECLSRCRDVKSLDISGCDQLIEIFLPSLLNEYAGDLKAVILDECCTLTSAIFERFRSVLKLEVISCEGCIGLLDSSMNYFNHTVTPCLTDINVSGCQSISSNFIRYLTSVHGPTLKTVNISWSNMDCFSLIYLAGFTLSAQTCFAINDYIKYKDANINIPCAFKTEESDRPACRTASVYLKELCAYCTQDISTRRYSESVVSTVFDSYDDYDIIESEEAACKFTEGYHSYTGENQVDNDNMFSDFVVLSVNDVIRKSCSCSTSSLQSNVDETSIDYQTGVDIFQRVYQPQITSLDISHIKFLDVDIGTQCLQLFLRSCSSLIKLYMSWPELSNEMLTLIAQCENKLELLSLVDCEIINDDGVLGLVKHCQNIKAIDFKGLSYIQDLSFLQFVSVNCDLQYISLAESSITDSVLFKMASTLHNTLRHIDLSWCDNISDKGVVALVSACSKLNYIDLRQCNVSEASLNALTNNVNNLKMLGLCGIKGLNDATCSPLIKSLPHLQIIDLSWNSSLTDLSLRTLLESCIYLKEVTIAGLKRISSKPLLPLISEYKTWQDVRNKIRDKIHRNAFGKNKNFKHITELEHLDATFYLPFRSINYAANLHKLTLGYCDKVNDTHLGEIVAVCRGTLLVEDYYGEIIKPLW